MKKGLLVALMLALVLSLGVLVAACGGDGETEETTATTAAGTTTTAAAGDTTTTAAAETTTTAPVNTEPIKIGIALSLTGDSASPCVLIKEGFEAEAKYINDNGGIKGRQIELTFVDDQSLIDKASAAITQLIDQDMDVIIGPFPQWTTAPARKLTEEAGVFHIAFGPPTLVELMEDQTQYSYSFEAAAGPDAEAEAWVIALQNAGAKNVLGVGDQINIHQEGLQLMTQLCQDAGIQFTKMSDSWSLGESDLTPVANKIAAKVKEINPDAIIIANNPVHQNLMAKLLKGLGVTVPMYGSGAGSHPLAMLAPAGNDPANVAGDYAIGAPVVNVEGMPDEYPAKQDLLGFITRWKEMFPEEMFGSTHLGFAYDTIHLAEIAITNATEDTPEAWAEAMTQIDWWGAQGHFQYSPEDKIGIHGGFVLWQFQPDATFKYVSDLNAMTE